MDATAAQAFDRACNLHWRRVSSCAPPQGSDGVEPRTSFDTALKQLKAMGFDETYTRARRAVADAGLLAEWMLERPRTRRGSCRLINEGAG